MNNYKIIENRPELSSSQIIAGMNFGVVKAGALASTVTIAGVVISKAIISKWFIVAAVLGTSALVYKSYTAGNDTSDKNQPYTEEAVSAPPGYGSTSQKVMLEETAQVVSTNIKPIKIAIPTLAPTQSKTEATTEAVPSLTSPTSVMQGIGMPTITLLSPGNAVCQPGPNSKHTPPVNKLFKDSIK